MSVFIAAAVVSTGASIYNSAQDRRAVKNSKRAQLTAEEQAIEEQRRQYDQTRQDWEPWRTEGGNAMNRMGRAMTGDMSDFQKSPGYNFRLNEGWRDMENLFSVKGGGGNAMRALDDYRQGMATNEFGNWFNRNLAMSGQGQTAVSGTQTAGMNAANQIGSNRWRSAENMAGLNLYGANQQANYTNEILGGMLDLATDKWGKK